MKKSILLLMFIIGISYSSEAKETKEIKLNTNVEIIQNSYAGTAYTRKGYNEYSINITIYGMSTGYSNNISSVSVKGNSVSFTPVYGESGTYRFTYGGEEYYFTF
tara:strand:- start:78 stop:392 length:315 start_codon:yes stop_codon:yes gene_type:complete